MHYSKIYNEDVLNGVGFRTVLFVSGCNHKCDGCYNKSTWNPKDGFPYTNEIEDQLMHMVRSPRIDGITLSGGDPLYKDNLIDVLRIVKKVKSVGKTVWLWSGYTYEEAIENSLRKEILNYVDVFIDGKYDKEKPTTKPFRGSDNQRMFKFYPNSIEIKNIC